MSATASPIFTSFNGGEISPRMSARVDQQIYQISTAEMLNFVPSIEGPAIKRSGFRHIRAAAVTASWLSPFIFSDSQAYVLEWSDLKLRFYTNGGRIETSSVTPYEVAIPFTALEAPAISTQQSFDRLYIASAGHPPGSLLRTSATTFSYAPLTLTNGPFATRNSEQDLVATVGGSTGTDVFIQIAGAPFRPEHVGGYVMVEALSFPDVKAWEPQSRVDGALSVGDFRVSDGKVYKCVDLGTATRTGTIQPTHTHGSAWDGSGLSILGYDTQFAGVKWEYQYDAIGVGLITTVLNGAQVLVDVVRPFAKSSLDLDPSYRWAVPAWSASEGFPAHVVLAFGRLIFFTDFWIYASVVGDYGGGNVNMAPFSDAGLIAPDQAFSLRLDISNPILWAKKDRDAILLGTADGIYAVQKINASGIFSSDNIEVVKQGHTGVSRCPPVQTGNSTIYAQAGGRKLREAGYSLDTDRYVSPILNVWQRHITRSGTVQLAFQGEPDELLLAVRGDGQVVIHPYVPEQEVKGFARIAHGAGPVLSAVAIPDGEGDDQLWALVEGGNGRSVELQDPQWVEGETALVDAFYVDSGATYFGAATTTINGLDHLEGEAVAVLADGIVVSGKTVTGGAISLDVAAVKVQVGLPFTARISTLRPEFRDSAGNTSQRKRKRLTKLFLRVLDTLGVKVDTGSGKLEELTDRPTTAAMDTALPLYNGDTTRPLGKSWGTDGQYSIVSDEPLPCMVLAQLPEFQLSDA